MKVSQRNGGSVALDGYLKTVLLFTFFSLMHLSYMLSFIGIPDKLLVNVEFIIARMEGVERKWRGENGLSV